MTFALRAAAAAALLASLPALSLAQSGMSPPVLATPAGTMEVSPLVGFAFTGSGASLEHVTFINDGGSQVATDTIKAGARDYLYAGAELRRTASPWALQATVGYHWDTKEGDNGKITFARTPVEVLGMYQVLPWLRMGAGLRHDFNVYMNGAGVANVPELRQEYTSSTGGVVKLEWYAVDNLGVELRFSKVNYHLRKVDGQDPGVDYTADGRSFGVGATLHF